LARLVRRIRPNPEQVADPAPRDPPPRSEGLRPVWERRGRGREVPAGRTGEIDVFSPEEVWALVRAAATEQDGALFLAAAFTGLRMGELIALR
jgi:integrase